MLNWMGMMMRLMSHIFLNSASNDAIVICKSSVSPSYIWHNVIVRTYYKYEQMSNDGFSEIPLYLEKADVKAMFTYEREVYDFFWISASGGYRWNINFDVSDSDTFFDRAFNLGNSANLAISNAIGGAPFFRFGIFIVPPNKWMEN